MDCPVIDGHSGNADRATFCVIRRELSASHRELALRALHIRSRILISAGTRGSIQAIGAVSTVSACGTLDTFALRYLVGIEPPLEINASLERARLK
jgi:hypothetical protein